MVFRRIHLCLMPFLLAATAGCLHPLGKRDLGYQTIVSKLFSGDYELSVQENERALKLLEKKKYSAAEVALKKALAEDVSYGSGHNNLGVLYFEQGKFYLAAWEFRNAIKLLPEQPTPYNNLGMVYEAVGWHERAIEYYTLAWQMDQENPEFIGNLVRARIRQGERDFSIGELLSDLILCDTRPDWVAWAQQELSLIDGPFVGPPPLEALEIDEHEEPASMAPQQEPTSLPDEDLESDLPTPFPFGTQKPIRLPDEDLESELPSSFSFGTQKPTPLPDEDLEPASLWFSPFRVD